MITSNMFKNLPKKKLWIFLFLPLLFVTISLIIRQQHGPYWLGLNSDPDYAYLFNSLNITQLKTPGHTDHPGTTVQVLGGIIIQITYLIQYWTNSDTSNIVESVLQNPEFYLLTINTILLILITTCLFLLGVIAFSLCQSIALSLLLQLTPFWWTVLSHSIRVSPEPLLFCLSQLFVMLLLFYLYSDVVRLPQFALAIGVVFGLGVATKFTFLPLGLVILLFPGLPQKGLAIFTAITTFFLATLPVLSQYPRIFSWILSIATHTGRHGKGNQGLVDFSTLPNTFVNLTTQDTLFFYVIGISALNFFIITFWFGWYKFKNLDSQNLPNIFANNKFYHLFACLLLIILAQLLITLKHPATYYLLPSMGLCSLLILLQVVLFEQLLTPIFKPIILRWIGLFAFGLYIFATTTNAYNQTLLMQKTYKSYMGEVQTINHLIQQKYSNCTHAIYYRSANKEYALKFGNDFAASQYSQNLQSVYPNGIFYNPWSRKYESFNKELDLNTLLNKKCVIIHGYPLNQDILEYKEYIQLKHNTKMKPIFEGHEQAVYLITGNHH